MTKSLRVSPIWLGGGLFGAIGIVLIGVSAQALLAGARHATMPVALLAFGWASLSMAVSIVLATTSRGSRVIDERVAARRGTVTLQRRSRLTGPGVEAGGQAIVRVGSRAPAVFLACASVALAVTAVALVVNARASVIGAGFAIGLACYMANWARLAWPRDSGHKNA